MPITETTSLTTGAAVSRTNYKKIALCALALTAFAAMAISNKDAMDDMGNSIGNNDGYTASNADTTPPASTTMDGDIQSPADDSTTASDDSKMNLANTGRDANMNSDKMHVTKKVAPAKTSPSPVP